MKFHKTYSSSPPNLNFLVPLLYISKIFKISNLQKELLIFHTDLIHENKILLGLKEIDISM